MSDFTGSVHVDLRGTNYQDVETKLRKTGFSNVKTEPLGDLITGWVHDDGEVDEVSIDGETDFSRNSWHDEDAVIRIRYHSFPASTEEEEEKPKEKENDQSQDKEKNADAKKNKSQQSSKETKKNTASDEAKKQNEAKKQSEAKQRSKIENKIKAFEGKPVTDLEQYLTSIGYSATYVADNTGDDFTEAIKADAEMRDLFVVISVSRIDHAKKTVEVRMLGKEFVDAQNQQKNMEEALNEKLDKYVAWETVAAYGRRQYPGGFKVHYFISNLAERAEDENTWYLKALCDVTINGTKYKGLNCEARVTGTSDNPQITYFQVY